MLGKKDIQSIGYKFSTNLDEMIELNYTEKNQRNQIPSYILV